MNRISAAAGKFLANYLEKEVGAYTPYSVTTPDLLRQTLLPGDVLLVEGSTRISKAIKYLTQSTWSHATFCVRNDGVRPELIEADLKNGVHEVSVEKYRDHNTRICRPIALRPDDLETLLYHMASSLGMTYDLRNVWDLARYLLPQPPVPRGWRRRMLSLGSGDPTRAICSTLIADAFQQIRYPILPLIQPGCSEGRAKEILAIRHHSLFVPRDFDLSPFFRVVKPTIERGDFDYGALNWQETPVQSAAQS